VPTLTQQFLSQKTIEAKKLFFAISVLQAFSIPSIATELKVRKKNSSVLKGVTFACCSWLQAPLIFSINPYMPKAPNFGVNNTLKLNKT